MAFHPYVDIFEPDGTHLVKYCSMCYPTAPSLDHMGAAVQRAIDEDKMTWANTYIVVLTGRRPVEARQFIVVGQRGTLQIFAPSQKSPLRSGTRIGPADHATLVPEVP